MISLQRKKMTTKFNKLDRMAMELFDEISICQLVNAKGSKRNSNIQQSDKKHRDLKETRRLKEFVLNKNQQTSDGN